MVPVPIKISGNPSKLNFAQVKLPLQPAPPAARQTDRLGSLRFAAKCPAGSRPARRWRRLSDWCSHWSPTTARRRPQCTAVAALLGADKGYQCSAFWVASVSSYDGCGFVRQPSHAAFRLRGCLSPSYRWLRCSSAVRLRSLRSLRRDCCGQLRLFAHY